ncbi:hypothetical protein CRYUN_Cryun19dG0041100 [Craigia yunnanensis]
MVAISLYRGNLHRAPGIPRRWLMPTPKISLKDFNSLLHRRNKALSCLLFSSPTSNPNPIPDLKPQTQSQSPKPSGPPIEPKLEAQVESEPPEDLKTRSPPAKDKVEVVGGSDSEDCLMKPEDEQTKKDDNLQVDEKPPEETKTNVEVSEKVKDLNGKEKRKRDVEEKLQVLNAKKHNFVKILNAEEELKRRNSTQGTAIRPSVPLQVETTNDSGSMTGLVTPRMGSEANLAGENEGGEADHVSNLNIHSRHVFRMSSTSPSSESPLRRPTYIQHNVFFFHGLSSMAHSSLKKPLGWSFPFDGMSINYRSPSCFAPIGNQGHPGNPPAVSVSGTNYVASSPSPAASGGTSVFREAQQPSPWN